MCGPAGKLQTRCHFCKNESKFKSVLMQIFCIVLFAVNRNIANGAFMVLEKERFWGEKLTSTRLLRIILVFMNFLASL